MWQAWREIAATLRRPRGGAAATAATQEAPLGGSESFLDRETKGLLDRPHFAYALTRAAALAKRFGHERLTVCEFGVANGDGLINLLDLATQLTAETGISFRVVGFDLGTGLPPTEGHEDHPELWSAGDFVMEDQQALRTRLAGRAELVIGDVHDTVPGFLASVHADAPIGFLAVDVDLYTATRSALRVLDGPTDRYLPALPMYFDDVSSFFSNPWCGELRAIDEFNAAHELRKIDRDRTLAARPPAARGWHERMFVCHVLDHALRAKPSRGMQTADEHRAMIRGNPRGYL